MSTLPRPVDAALTRIEVTVRAKLSDAERWRMIEEILLHLYITALRRPPKHHSLPTIDFTKD